MASPDGLRPDPVGRSRALVLWVGLGGLLLAGAAGYYLWREYDPFFDRRPANREANELLAAARAGPLSDDQFARVTALADSGEPVAQLQAVAVLQVEAGRRPDRKDPAAAALTRMQQSANGNVSKAAAAALGRLNAPAGGEK